jgi:hypothetical protein
MVAFTKRNYLPPMPAGAEIRCVHPSIAIGRDISGSYSSHQR